MILPEDLPEALAETAEAAEAAKILGVHPNYLHRLVRNLDLRTALKSTG